MWRKLFYVYIRILEISTHNSAHFTRKYSTRRNIRTRRSNMPPWNWWGTVRFCVNIWNNLISGYRIMIWGCTLVPIKICVHLMPTIYHAIRSTSAPSSKRRALWLTSSASTNKIVTHHYRNYTMRTWGIIPRILAELWQQFLSSDKRACFVNLRIWKLLMFYSSITLTQLPQVNIAVWHSLFLYLDAAFTIWHYSIIIIASKKRLMSFPRPEKLLLCRLNEGLVDRISSL